MIPIFKPYIDKAGIKAFIKTVNSHWFMMGPKVAEFEEAFSAYIGTNHTIALNSATSALDLALKLLNLEKGDEVIVPVMTFCSTGHAVVYNGLRLVFADIDPITLNIDPEDVRQKITDRTRAIIPVHYGGRPCDIDALRVVIGDRDIKIIEDSAHASGASYKGNKVGTLGHMSCFSFHAVKPLAIGDGGAITLNDTTTYGRGKRLSWMGINKDTHTRSLNNYKWEYDVDEIGYKYHMNDLMASLALTQLKRLDKGIKARERLSAYYYRQLYGIDEIQRPLLDDENYQSSWHLYCIKCDKRDALSEYLSNNGISTGVHYKPINLFKCYGERVRIPIAEMAYQEILTLPLFETMTFGQVDYVVKNIKKFYAKA